MGQNSLLLWPPKVVLVLVLFHQFCVRMSAAGMLAPMQVYQWQVAQLTFRLNSFPISRYSSACSLSAHKLKWATDKVRYSCSISVYPLLMSQVNYISLSLQQKGDEFCGLFPEDLPYFYVFWPWQVAGCHHILPSVALVWCPAGRGSPARSWRGACLAYTLHRSLSWPLTPGTAVINTVYCRSSHFYAQFPVTILVPGYLSSGILGMAVFRALWHTLLRCQQQLGG